MADIRARIESEIEVQAYLQDLRYALNHGAQVSFHYAEIPFAPEMFPYKKKEGAIS